MRPDVATTICLVLKDENTYCGASEEKKKKPKTILATPLNW